MKAAFAIGLFKAVLSPREVNEKKLIKKSNSEKDKEKPWSIEVSNCTHPIARYVAPFDTLDTTV